MSFTLKEAKWCVVHAMRDELEGRHDIADADWSSVAQMALSPVGPKGDCWAPLSWEEMDAILNGPGRPATETFTDEVNRRAYHMSPDDRIRFAAWLLDVAPGYARLSEQELIAVNKKLDDEAEDAYWETDFGKLHHEANAAYAHRFGEEPLR
ncbi:hypothetical protein C0Z10_09450 [Acidipropionibacterium jensenii]|uniref:Uncharacterized protein n=1 Tax=Acidipropionibacterium jensenii TaxID=1749 RepID=A0A3T0S0Q2_9ACTN|nr:hypothetical protein [Acidipropionibacterium jensenii]AZZ39940.1 hypothetical protein C0Z10_09450 [Acidipropionibacterium jensenii]